MAPALTRLVAERRFPALEQKQGASFFGSVARSLGLTLLALLALVVSMPLWLIPPLVLILPPLIWGWLTYRVMSFDALAEHASREERARAAARAPLAAARHRRAVAATWARRRAASGRRALLFAAAFARAGAGRDLDLHAGVRVLGALVRALLPRRAGAAARAARRARPSSPPAAESADASAAATPMGCTMTHDHSASSSSATRSSPASAPTSTCPRSSSCSPRAACSWPGRDYVGDEPARITADADARLRLAATSCSPAAASAPRPTTTRASAPPRRSACRSRCIPRREMLIRERMQDTAREQGTAYEPDRPDNLHRLNMGVFPLGARDHPQPVQQDPRLQRRRRALRAGLSGHGLADDRMGARHALRRTCSARGRDVEKSVIVFGAMEATLTPLMEAIERAHRRHQGVQPAERRPSRVWPPHRARRQGRCRRSSMPPTRSCSRACTRFGAQAWPRIGALDVDAHRSWCTTCTVYGASPGASHWHAFC